MPAKKTSMEEKEIRFADRSFRMNPNQVLYFDPDGTSEFSTYIEANLDDIECWFFDLGYRFCYIPDVCKNITEEEIRYLIPNWNGEPLHVLGNDVLKPLLVGKYSKTKAGFIRVSDESWMTYSHFLLVPLDKMGFEVQLEIYKPFLLERINSCNNIRFSISNAENDDNLYSVFEKKMSLADKSFSEDGISTEIRRIVEYLHKEGLEEFVLRCMVPIEGKLSRMVITPKYEIILPEYGNQIVEMSPLPKAVYLLFLRHEEGLFFKELVDYKDELRAIYEKITNRTSTDVIDDSLDKVTDPTNNAINEKNSRITEAFVKHIDKSLAKSYCITGLRSERKRITLPRKLVEWQCELPL